jgi:23S rRNA (uridine2552-2'-O)-methyltransferase
MKSGTDKGNNPATRRRATVRVKTAAKRSLSSARWLDRQLNDPYVAAAKDAGYRSRAAFKLIQLDEQFKLLKTGQRVLDLGAAPGGWSQIAARKIGKSGKLVGIDLLPIAPLPGAQFIELDFTDDAAPGKLQELLQGPADLVLSDMAPSTTGHTATDHIRIMALAEVAAHFAASVLTPGGAFVCKLFKGGGEKHFIDQLKQDYSKIKFAKPAASRADSSETYLVAQGFRRATTK